MGLSPRQVDEMTIWEMQAAVAGWNRANGGEQQIERLTEDEFDDMLAQNAAWIASRRQRAA